MSAVSFSEIAIKHSLRRGGMPVSAKEAAGYFHESGFRVLAVQSEHLLGIESLPAIHGDPFDRLLVAQALTEPMRLLTSDGVVAPYSDTTIAVLGPDFGTARTQRMDGSKMTMSHDHGHEMKPPASIAAGAFKAECLSLLDSVARTRRPLVITKRGKPVAQLVPMPDAPALFGALSGSVVGQGDLVSGIGEVWDAGR